MPQYDSLSLAFSSSKPSTRSIFQNSTTQKCTPQKHQSFLKCIKAFLPPLQPKTKCTKPLLWYFWTQHCHSLEACFVASLLLGLRIFCFCSSWLHILSRRRAGLLFLTRWQRSKDASSSFEAFFYTSTSSWLEFWRQTFLICVLLRSFVERTSEIIFFLKGQTVLLHFVICSRLYVHSTLIDYCRIWFLL